MASPLLQSWKEIALYLQVGVRTAQRWERSLGLPVHHTGIKGRVFGVRDELDTWLNACPKRGGSEFALDLLDQINETFYAVDREWRFVYVNSAAARAWNTDRHSLIGKQIFEVLPRFIDSDIHHTLMNTAQSGTRATFEGYSNVLGKRISVVAYPLRNGGLAVSFHDAAPQSVKAKHHSSSAA